MKKIFPSILKLSLIFLILEKPAFAASKTFISIGTGAITGVYYPAGGGICRLVNLNQTDTSAEKISSSLSIRCSPESTSGSISNINGIRNGALDFGIVQSDMQYSAYKGIGIFSDQKKFDELRSVFSLFTETFVMAVSEKSNIKKLDDIVNKKVNFGSPSSGFYATMEALMNAKGWNKGNFSEVTYIQPSEQPKALCDGKIDVMIYSAGNPNGVIQEATQLCKVRLISIEPEVIKELTKTNPYYVRAIIPGGMYSGNPSDVETFGVKASLVTSANTKEELVYYMTKVVFEKLNTFKTLHPVFLMLDKKEMIYDGNSAPMHKGARRYFCEQKLIKCTE